MGEVIAGADREMVFMVAVGVRMPECNRSVQHRRGRRRRDLRPEERGRHPGINCYTVVFANLTVTRSVTVTV